MKTRAARRRMKAIMANYRNVATQTETSTENCPETSARLGQNSNNSHDSSFISLPDPCPRRRQVRNRTQSVDDREKSTEPKLNGNRQKLARIKPGPLCSKRRRIEKHQENDNDDNLQIPVMLGVETRERSVENVVERYRERTKSPEVNVDLPEINVNHEEIVLIEPQDCHNANNQNNREIPRNDKDNNGQNNGDDRSIDNNKEGFEEDRQFIQITAQTVHIHNHFYKTN